VCQDKEKATSLIYLFGEIIYPQALPLVANEGFNAEGD
jgi:hypothetical protein